MYHSIQYHRVLCKRSRCTCSFIVAALSMFSVVGAIASDKTDTPLNLKSLIEQVLQNNPEIPRTRASWQSAKAKTDQVSAYPDPMLSYSVAPQTIFSKQSDYGQIINVSQVMPWPGKLNVKKEIAQWQASAIRETIGTTRLALIAASKMQFADWQYVHAAIELNTQNKSLLQEFKNIAEIKYSAGRASKQDVLRAEVEFTLLEKTDEALNRQKATIAAQINNLLNWASKSPLAMPNQDVVPYPLIDIRRLPQLVLQSHPRLKQINASLVAAEKQQLLAKREFYPDIQLKVSYNSLRMNTDNQFTVGVGFNIPLSEKRNAAVDEASFKKSTLNWRKQSLIAEINKLIQIHHARVVESEQVIKLFESRILPLAEDNLKAARSDYESGQGNFLDMITAEQNLIRLQLQLLETRSNYKKQVALLEEISGGSEILEKSYLSGKAPSNDRRYMQ